MPIRKLPEAPQAAHIIGPAMILVALGVGLGETFLWPRLVIVFGPNIRWMFLVGVMLQTVVMLEMARYAMATGESIFFGAARVWQPIMWLFFVTAIAVYIWPGHISTGADALEELTGIPWQLSASLGLVIIGLMFTIVKFVYNIVEAVLAFLVGVLVIGSAIIAAIVGSLSDLGDTLVGLVALRLRRARTPPSPPRGSRSSWGRSPSPARPACSRCGTRCGCATRARAWASHMPRVRGLLHAGEEETIPDTGSMFDTDDPDEMRKWNNWRKWVRYDAILLFFGITMLVTIIFTVLAMHAAEVNPEAKRQLLAGERDAALTAMRSAFDETADILGTLFFIFISIVGWKASVGLFDAFARGQSDMTYYFVPGAKKFKMAHLYGLFLWGVIIFGILIINFGPVDGPTGILNVLAFMSTFVMGAYCLTLAGVNRMMLPKKIRPHMVVTVLLVLGGITYLGMLFYSMIKFGVTDLG